VLQQTWYTHEHWNIVGEILENPTMHRFVLTVDKNAEAPPTIQAKLEEVTESRLSTSSSNASREKTILMKKIHCYEAFKYGPEEMKKQFDAAGYAVLAIWKAPHVPYCKFARYSHLILRVLITIVVRSVHDIIFKR
jgi:hypothetical protein